MCLSIHVHKIWEWCGTSTALCRLPDSSSMVATLWETSSSVKSLSFEDPWLAAALADGSVAMLQTDVAAKHAKHGQGLQTATKANSRLFQMPQGGTHCVALSDQWLVAGSGTELCCAMCTHVTIPCCLRCGVQYLVSWLVAMCRRHRLTLCLVHAWYAKHHIPAYRCSSRSARPTSTGIYRLKLHAHFVFWVI